MNHGRTLRSLQLFFDYLATAGIECPWAEPILADSDALERRIRYYHECVDDDNVSDWGAELVGYLFPSS